MKKSKAARMLPLLNQSRLRIFPVVPFEYSRRAVEVPAAGVSSASSKEWEVLQNLSIAHGVGRNLSGSCFVPLSQSQPPGMDS